MSGTGRERSGILDRPEGGALRVVVGLDRPGLGAHAKALDLLEKGHWAEGLRIERVGAGIDGRIGQAAVRQRAQGRRIGIERKRQAPVLVLQVAAAQGAAADIALDEPALVELDAAKGFVLLPRRWVVERTLVWLNGNRRLAKDVDATIESSVTWLYIASVKLMSQRMARA